MTVIKSDYQKEEQRQSMILLQSRVGCVKPSALASVMSESQCLVKCKYWILAHDNSRPANLPRLSTGVKEGFRIQLNKTSFLSYQDDPAI